MKTRFAAKRLCLSIVLVALVLIGLSTLVACGVLEAGIEPVSGQTPVSKATGEGASTLVVAATPTSSAAAPTVAITVTVMTSEEITESQHSDREISLVVTPVLTGTQAATDSGNSLWIEYWDPRYGYGLALPCFWHIYPTPKDAVQGSPHVTSYDELFALAHSVRGHWIDGKWPPGAIKMDISVFEDIDPTASLEDAVKRRLVDWDIQSIEPGLLGDHEALVVVLEDQQGEPAGTNRVHVTRLSPGSFILFSVMPRQALETPTIRGILASLARSHDEGIAVPEFSPGEPVEGREIYVNEQAGYCLQYPSEFVLEKHDSSQPMFLGEIANLKIERPLYQVGLAVEVWRVGVGNELVDHVDAYLSRFDDQGVSRIHREPAQLGGEPAEIVEGISGREGSRDVFALHENKIYHISCVPSLTDFEQAIADLETLLWIVTGSFSFLPEHVR